jgi:protein tyrosine phosphatase
MSRSRPQSVALPEHIPEFLRCAHSAGEPPFPDPKVLKKFDEIEQEEEDNILEAQDDPTGQHPYSWSVAIERDNREKNRYTNILPYNRTRVLLEPIRVPYSNIPIHGDYINASWIQAPGGIRKYIATQGPMPKTLVDFWRMIWQEKVRVLVMLTDTYERGKVKCHPYWPSAIGESMKFDTAGIEIKLISEEKALNGEAMIRQIEVIKRAPQLPAEPPTILLDSSNVGNSDRRRDSSGGSMTLPMRQTMASRSATQLEVQLNDAPLPSAALQSSYPDGLAARSAVLPGTSTHVVTGVAPTAPPPNFMLAKPPLSRKGRGKKSLMVNTGGSKSTTALSLSTELPSTPSFQPTSRSDANLKVTMDPPKADSDSVMTESPSSTMSRYGGGDLPQAKSPRTKGPSSETQRSRRGLGGGRHLLAHLRGGGSHSSHSNSHSSGSSSSNSHNSSHGTQSEGGKSSHRGLPMSNFFRGISDWFQWITRVNAQEKSLLMAQRSNSVNGVASTGKRTSSYAIGTAPSAASHSAPHLLPTLPGSMPLPTFETTATTTTKASDVPTPPPAPGPAPMLETPATLPPPGPDDAHASTTFPPPPAPVSVADAMFGNRRDANAPPPASAPLPQLGSPRTRRSHLNHPPASASIRDPVADQQMLSPIVLPEPDSSYADLIANMHVVPDPPSYTSSTGEAFDETSGVQRAVVTQVHFLGWPDHGVPSSPDGVLRLIRLVNRLQGHSDTNGPVLVHCSAGCGRTGTFCVIDSAIAILTATRDGSIDLVYQLTRHFRAQRCTMVQTSQQYWFCYVAILRRFLTVLQRNRSMSL